MTLPVIIRNQFFDEPVELVWPPSPILPVEMTLTTSVYEDGLAVILDLEDQNGYLLDCEDALAVNVEFPERPLEADLVPASVLGRRPAERLS